ncbi:MAG: DNA-directed RNA polymerase subunit omega [Vicinamibacterales bacterium]
MRQRLERLVMHRPDGINAFEFVRVAAQRAAQLMGGCLPRVPVGSHKVATVAQFEVAAGMVKALPRGEAVRAQALEASAVVAAAPLA